MAAQAGAGFLLKLVDEAGAAVAMAGLRTTEMAICGTPVEAASCGAWRVLLDRAGVRALQVKAEGLFIGSAAEMRVRDLALAGALATYQLAFEDGTIVAGSFLVRQLDYAGDHDGERQYRLELESSGPVETR